MTTSRVSGYQEMEAAALLLYAAAALKAAGHSAAELQAMPRRKAERALNTPFARNAQPIIAKYRARRYTETGLLALTALVQLCRDTHGHQWVQDAVGAAHVHLDALPHLPPVGAR